MSSLTERLVLLLRRPVEEADRARAALHLLDWLGAAAAGAARPEGGPFRRRAAPPGPCRILSAADAAPSDAAFANGAFGNILEMDDVHRGAILHPGPVVWPAVLAAAQAAGASPQALLDAAVRGYEAMIRLGRALGPAHYARFHNTATAGPAGSAAAVADLSGLSEGAFADALGNALSTAGGLWQCRHEAVLTKQWHTAQAARAGLDAAMLAALGLSGARRILEGPQGFLPALCPDGEPSRILEAPDGPWLIHETSFKPWPACRHCHPAIDAALALREAASGRAIAAADVATYADAVLFCDKPEPGSEAEAKFSLQHAVAVALLDGPPPLAAFTPEAARRPEVAALRARIRVRTDPRFTARYPAHFGAALTLRLADGAVLSAEVPDALGDPENPLPAGRVAEKAMALFAAAGLEDSHAAALRDAALSLPGAADARTLFALLP
ncbi:MAG: MmgE/PrpD family protein [Acetobacteraceae bacterium]|nr:MmgE/PrpD family protein [Acetobacteraceae bacterium]